MADSPSVGKHIYFQRLLNSIVCTAAIQVALVLISVCVLQVDIFHPISWMMAAAKNLFSIKTVIFVVPFVFLTFLQGIVCGKYYVSEPHICYSRFTALLHLICARNVVMCSLHGFSGLALVHLCASLVGPPYSRVSRSCDHGDVSCLNEEYIFVQLGGIWIGLYYFLTVYVFGYSSVVFPPIQQRKFIQVKTGLNTAAHSAIKNSLLPVFYFTVLYYYWGSIFRISIARMFNLHLEGLHFNSIVTMMKSGATIYLCLFSSLYLISMYIMRTLFNIFLTEHIVFPIENCSLTLENALCHKLYFIQLHGARDLLIMSMTDKERRKQVFSLSLPGQHPYNWHHILQHCLNVVNSFNQELEKIILDLKNDDSNKSHMPSDMVSSHYCNSTIRNMASVSPQLARNRLHLQHTVTDELHVTIKATMERKYKSIVQSICQKPYVRYFFGELIDYKLRSLLNKSQLVIWIVESLAFMISASLTEDTYGVVQNDLSTVFCTLITLKINLEKLSKLGLVHRKYVLGEIFTAQMKAALSSTVKRSIYKMTNTFSKYMHDIPLTPEIRHALQPFVMFMEA